MYHTYTDVEFVKTVYNPYTNNNVLQCTYMKLLSR